MKIGKREFDTKHHTYVMGILNVTPDSFSDGGSYNSLDKALFQTEQMLKQGVDILDIGGESTRPGYEKISDQEEMDRILPVIEGIRREFDPVISVDTYKWKVAEEAILTGADLINDIWGFRQDDKMAEIVSKYQVACCLMHNRELSKNSDVKSRHREHKGADANTEVFSANDVMGDIIRDLSISLDIASNAGVKKEKIILDPGVGFGKTYEMNLDTINRLEQMKVLGYPVLLGTSRKSVIGLTLNLPVEQREEGTLATTVMAVMKGCSFVRVHDVLANKRAIQMTEAVLERG